MTGDERDGLRVTVDLRRLRAARPQGLALRFVFGAAISIAAALVGMRLGHRAGGLFLSFPAILPASLTLIEDKHGKHPAQVNAIGAALGGVALAAFAAAALLLLPRAPLPLTLVLLALVWLGAAATLYFAAAYLLALAGRHPEAPDEDGSLRHRPAG